MDARILPFDCVIYDSDPVEVSNRFSGESIVIPPDAVAVYDSVIGAEYISDWDTVRKGIDWFIEYEPKAYGVLLD
jgi:hypothetical protein